MDKKDKQKQVHEDLEGLDVKINRFGQIESNFDIDKVNAFLNKETKDKKIVGDEKSDSENQDEEE